jgi:hypothetical protein
MVKRLVGLISTAAMVMVIAGCAPILLYNKELPDFKAPADRALCVIVRPVAFTGSSYLPIYCDTTYVGGTEGNTVLSFPVDPGEHFIIADATNKSKVKYNFQAGKVYFIFHTVVVVSTTVGPATITVTTSTFKPKSGADAMAKIESEKGKISWVQPNPENPQENLSGKDFAEIQKDYEKWASKEKNAEDFHAERDYPGY